MATDEWALRSGEVAASRGARTAERSLVDRCRQGDPEAFARLVALHEGMVFNLATRLLGTSDEARDVAQDVFLQVYRRLDRFEGRSSLKTWIYRIVVNSCRNRQRFWRRRHRERCCSLETLAPRDAACLATDPTTASPLMRLERRETAERVQIALMGLSFPHRVILLLREVEGLSGDEIAETLGIARGTVKSRLARAREALRQRLLPWLGEGEPSC